MFGKQRLTASEKYIGLMNPESIMLSILIFSGFCYICVLIMQVLSNLTGVLIKQPH